MKPQEISINLETEIDIDIDILNKKETISIEFFEGSEQYQPLNKPSDYLEENENEINIID